MVAVNSQPAGIWFANYFIPRVYYRITQQELRTRKPVKCAQFMYAYTALILAGFEITS